MTYGLVDFHGCRPATTGGLPGLIALARQLLGEPLLFARRGYPDELKLHFGSPIEGVGPKGKPITRGSYVLGAVASAWTLKISRLGGAIYSGEPSAPFSGPVTQPWLSPITEAKLDESLALLGGQSVVSVDVLAHPFGYALWLAMSDGSALTIAPTPEPARDVPDWELFTPYNRFLRVGPGSEWAYLPSDQPESKDVKSVA